MRLCLFQTKPQKNYDYVDYEKVCKEDIMQHELNLYREAHKRLIK